MPCHAFSHPNSNKVFHARCYAHDSRAVIYAYHSFSTVPPRYGEAHTILAPRLIESATLAKWPLFAHHESQVPHLRVLASIFSVAVDAAVMMAKRGGGEVRGVDADARTEYLVRVTTIAPLRAGSTSTRLTRTFHLFLLLRGA